MARAGDITLPIGEGGTVRIACERVCEGAWIWQLTTSHPGHGGLYGGRPPADETRPNQYQAVMAALIAARSYWIGKDEHVLARDVQKMIAEYSYDVDVVGTR